MIVQPMTLAEIRREGLAALFERLGPVGMVRFLQQFESGYGDYTTERHAWVDKMDVKTLVNQIRERREIRAHVLRERGCQEAAPDDLVVVAIDGEVAEIVLLEESVEDVGSQNDRRRHRDRHSGEHPLDLVLGDQTVDEREAAGLAAQRASADPGKPGFRVEVIEVEVGDHAAGPLPTVVGDGPDQVLA